MFAESPIKRRKSTRINVGTVPIGDGAPIAVQSMTNTDTSDVAATVAQIKRIQAVGADIVRVSVPTMDAAEAFSAYNTAIDGEDLTEEEKTTKIFIPIPANQ